MADIYLSSVDGSDASDGLSWANAKATLVAALTAAGAGGRVFVDHAHAETQASVMTLLSPGTAASPVQVLCVDRTGDPEPPTALATTATVTTTANNAITFSSGFTYVYGIIFSAGSGAVNSILQFPSGDPCLWILESCSLRGNGTASFSIIVGSSGNMDEQTVELVNTTHSANNAGGGVISVRVGKFIWRDTPSAIIGDVPATLFSGVPNTHGVAYIHGVDLSAMGSGDSLVNGALANKSYFRFENCKLGSSVAIITGSIPSQSGVEVTVVNCDSADTNYRYHRATYQGTIDHETTIIRTGGASDGTTGISRKMVSSANAKLYSPLVLDGIAVWNEDTGSAITATIEVVTDNVTLTDKEAWLEVEYLGTSGFPLSLTATDRASANNAHLGSGTNQTSSSETWTTTGLTTPVKQKLAVTFTPQEKGPIRLRVMLAKPSTTMYVCPKPTIA